MSAPKKFAVAVGVSATIAALIVTLMWCSGGCRGSADTSLWEYVFTHYFQGQFRRTGDTYVGLLISWFAPLAVSPLTYVTVHLWLKGNRWVSMLSLINPSVLLLLILNTPWLYVLGEHAWVC